MASKKKAVEVKDPSVRESGPPEPEFGYPGIGAEPEKLTEGEIERQKRVNPFSPHFVSDSYLPGYGVQEDGEPAKGEAPAEEAPEQEREKAEDSQA